MNTKQEMRMLWRSTHDPVARQQLLRRYRIFRFGVLLLVGLVSVETMAVWFAGGWGDIPLIFLGLALSALFYVQGRIKQLKAIEKEESDNPPSQPIAGKPGSA